MNIRRRRNWTGLFVFGGLLCGLLIQAAIPGPPALSQDAYVWNRAWTEPVRRSVQTHGSAFGTLVILAAEVSWKKTEPQVVRVQFQSAPLKNLGRPVGLAMRVGPWPGPFGTTQPSCQLLTGLAQSVLESARGIQLEISEFELDFDCAQSKLAGYRTWVHAIRRAIAPIPLVITALPSWLDEADFKPLAAEADGYVLQVHSLERPRGFDSPFSLCDPAAAKHAVESASRLQIPFRVALPTYGYQVAFDATGNFTGLAAESAMKRWPKGVRVREVMSNPVEIAALVQQWAADHPPAMRGIIWYRLPVETDTLCWRWRTLREIMALRSPRESLRAEACRVESGLVEISLINEGDLDISSRLTLETRWSRDGGARLLAGDGLRGFEMVDAGPSTARFQPVNGFQRLAAGDRRVIGWLRFNQDREVQIEIRRDEGSGSGQSRPH